MVYPKNNLGYISNSGNPIDISHRHNASILRLNLSKVDGDPDVFVILKNHSSIMLDMTYWLRINNKKVDPTTPMLTGVDGIALSCDFKILYYTH